MAALDPKLDAEWLAKLEAIMRRLMAAGLRSLPGGGGEILVDHVRWRIGPGKATGRQWLDVMRTAHRLGIPTHCTMLYGHVETYEERVDHVLRLRDQQDRTGGFLAFIPLAFHPENTVFERRGWRHATGAEEYLAFSGEVEAPEPGEVIFADAANQVHARRWTFRQSRRSTVGQTTRRALIVSEGLHATAAADVPALIDALAGEVAQVWGAPAGRAVLTAEAPRWELP